jgi:hypothetical protein
MPSLIERAPLTPTPSTFMFDLNERIDDLTTLSMAISARADRFIYPPVNALVSALKKAEVIPAELAGELLDAIPLLSRAIAGKSDFYDEAAEWAASRGPAVLAGLKETYQQAVTC